MAEDVVVDFSRVETGLNLVARAQGLAVEKERARINGARAATAAKLITYAAGACALVFVSIGVAIWRRARSALLRLTAASPNPAKLDVPSTPSPPSQSPPREVPQNKVMTKVAQFNSIAAADLSFFIPYLSELVAGHEYSTSNADRWENAWCYAMFRRDGVTNRLTLEQRYGTSIVPAVASDAERRLLGLNGTDISSLRARCPWKPR